MIRSYHNLECHMPVQPKLDVELAAEILYKLQLIKNIIYIIN